MQLYTEAVRPHISQVFPVDFQDRLERSLDVVRVLRVRGVTIEGEIVEIGSGALDAPGYDLLALVTGSLWGRPMWGTYWEWDARLTSVLILFLMYLSLIALWRAVDDPSRAARAASPANSFWEAFTALTGSCRRAGAGARRRRPGRPGSGRRRRRDPVLPHPAWPRDRCRRATDRRG